MSSDIAAGVALYCECERQRATGASAQCSLWHLCDGHQFILVLRRALVQRLPQHEDEILLPLIHTASTACT
ncbi:hypothetical protein ACHNHT_004822, partial [Salmonella enterica]